MHGHSSEMRDKNVCIPFVKYQYCFKEVRAISRIYSRGQLPLR